MSVTLWDAKDGNTEPYNVQSRAWRAIVEIIGQLGVLPYVRSELLHDIWNPEATLTASEAKSVAEAIESKLLPRLADDEFVLLDGSTSSDEGSKINWDEWHANWLVSREVLVSFCDYCKRCDGFFVRQ